jgi:hypothetical protein
VSLTCSRVHIRLITSFAAFRPPSAIGLVASSEPECTNTR